MRAISFIFVVSVAWCQAGCGPGDQDILGSAEDAAASAGDSATQAEKWADMAAPQGGDPVAARGYAEQARRCARSAQAEYEAAGSSIGKSLSIARNHATAARSFANSAAEAMAQAERAARHR